MRIELELKDPEYCNGCPLLHESEFSRRMLCRLGYNVCRQTEAVNPKVIEFVKDIPRPEECRMRNGR
jgi:hypothetical protein